MIAALLNLLFHRCPRTPREEALRQVRRHLRGRVSKTTLSIAEARAQRHLAHGRAPDEAAAIAVRWALSVQHPSWAA